jgi:methylenetetrahydrofolate reductase (NADPH)
MNSPKMDLRTRVQSGNRILLAEISVDARADAAAVGQLGRRYAGKVHAVGVSDNRDRVGMAALAAASLIAGQGVETILHVTTRDRNRIALVSEALGARALGISNILCTSGSHQTLGRFRAARNVYDIDVVQLLQSYAHLADDASLVGEAGIAGAGPFCLGAVASPDADPLDLQVSRLGKKTAAGAAFLITHPVYDLERFSAWWAEVTRRGIAEKVAIVAGIETLGDAELDDLRSGKRGRPHVPEAVAARITAKTEATARQRAAIDLALETMERLSETKGLRGFSVCVDGSHDAALEIIEKSGLGS